MSENMLEGDKAYDNGVTGHETQKEIIGEAGETLNMLCYNMLEGDKGYDDSITGHEAKKKRESW
jgi:hypothetical protein